MHIGVIPLLLLCFAGSLSSQRGSYRSLVEPSPVLTLPDLPYSYAALEPHLDTATLRVHHQGHHRAYCDKTNAALEEWRAKVSNRAWVNM